MRRIYLIPISLMAILPGTVQAQIEDLEVGPEPEWVDVSDLKPVPDDAMGLAFLRRNDVLIHLNENGQSTYQSQRMKLLDSRALEAGNVGLSWNPEIGEPVVHKLLIHRDGTVIDVLDKNRFEVIRREDQLEQSMLNGILTAVLKVPDLRVGDELEWAFTVPSNDPTLGADSFGLMALGATTFAGRHKIGISWTKGQKPTIQLTDDLAGSERRTSRTVSVTLDNPEIITPPKDAPIRYNWQRVLEYSDFKSWTDISQKFNELYVNTSKLSPDSQIIEEAKRIASTHSKDLDRTKAALKLVQQQVRYIYVGLNGGNIKPATADDTWQRRYGDCKGKTTLLMALLRELDIESEAVLVNNSGIDDGFEDRLPNAALFNHVLLRTEIDGTRYWLDPTLPAVIEPSEKSIVPYRWVLPLSNKGSNLESIPQSAFEVPQEMGLVEYDAREGFEEPARKVHTNVQRGLKGLAEYMQYSALTSEQLKTGLSNLLTGSPEWDEISDVSYRYDPETQASILKITGLGPVDWDDEGNGKYDLTLPGGGFSPPSRRQRAEEDNDDVPFYSEPTFSCHATTVRLPEDTELVNWGFNSTYETKIFGRRYYRMMERRDDGTIRMVRSSRTENPEITPAHARRDNNRIDDFDNSKGRIEYNPSKVMTPWGNLRSVPATYEIDWASANAPCLPKIETENR